MLWSVAVLAGAAVFVTIPIFALIPTSMTVFLAPGLVMMAMMVMAMMVMMVMRK